MKNLVIDKILRCYTIKVNCMKGVYIMKEFNFKSNTKMDVIIDKHYITLRPKGVMNALNRGFTGEKTIDIFDISAVQYKKPGIMTTGYLQLVIKGSLENKGGVLGAVKDENTILFGKKEDDQALKVKTIIERIKEKKNSRRSISVQNTVSVADEIRKLKQLMDEGILTEEEFNKQKAVLLS